MQGNWFDRLKYKKTIEKALDPSEKWANESARQEIVAIDALLAPAFELVEFEASEDKYVYYGDFTRAIEPLLIGTEWHKIRSFLADFELA